MYFQKRKRWRGREIVEPSNEFSYQLEWEPEPFFAMISDDGIVPHTYMEHPNTKVFLATTIDKMIFDRHARYLAGKDFYSAVWETMQFTSSACPICLLKEEDDNNIYCVSQPMGTFIVIGKLLKENALYKRCDNAFRKLCSQ